MRTEKEIFDDLENLCTSAGYAHVIAYFCYRDNWVRYSEEMNKDDVAHLYSRSRLIRTEISTLIGLLIKKPVDFTLPAPDVVQSYVNDTERLLEELHTTMEAPIFAELLSAAGNDGAGVFSTGKAMREPIFYGSEPKQSLIDLLFVRALFRDKPASNEQISKDICLVL